MPAMTKFARIAPAGLELLSRHRLWTRIQRQSVQRAIQSAPNSAPHRGARGRDISHHDEDFLTSDDPDFHPTDVMEDADGSLLVVETGAWYLHSCPVSRIAKPEIKGAIYRVRKKGAPQVDDPRGAKLRLAARIPAEHASLLGDPRPAVRDQAVERLVQAGEAAVQPVIQVRETILQRKCGRRPFSRWRVWERQKRCAPRWTIATSWCAWRRHGWRACARDHEAMPRLMQIVVKDHPAARRQAATALGQIGDARAVPALLAAAADPDDRFVEHAIIYSLITLVTPQPVAAALTNRSSKIRKAALIAWTRWTTRP